MNTAIHAGARKRRCKPVRLSSTKIRQIGIYFRHSRTYLRQAGTWLRHSGTGCRQDSEKAGLIKHRSGLTEDMSGHQEDIPGHLIDRNSFWQNAKSPAGGPSAFQSAPPPGGTGGGNCPPLSVFKWIGPRRTMLRAAGEAMVLVCFPSRDRERTAGIPESQGPRRARCISPLTFREEERTSVDHFRQDIFYTFVL